MTAFLLDVNVLIALLDPAHIHHEEAHNWFSAQGRKAWASCPLTENSVLRILGDQRYPNSPGNPSAVAEILAELFALPGHVFWPDDISILDREKLDPSRLLTSRQVTDSYLLALARAHKGQLATLDRRLIPDAVKSGPSALHLIV
ncbi:MAG: TA system VapC family ribonuclease toxin [Candidatus Acidiferrum sp.]